MSGVDMTKPITAIELLATMRALEAHVPRASAWAGAPPSLFGIPLRVSQYVPVDTAYYIAPPGYPPLVVRGFTSREHLAEIWRQCRRDIAARCPLIAPPEWREE